MGGAPLVEQTVDIQTENENCTSFLESHGWRLPVSSSQPELVTAARVDLDMNKPLANANWRVTVHFSFPDPLPLGIPFTFQKIQLSWNDQQLTEDWSDSCQFAGRGMFPGQAFDVAFELPDSAALCHPNAVILKIWGARY